MILEEARVTPYGLSKRVQVNYSCDRRDWGEEAAGEAGTRAWQTLNNASNEERIQVREPRPVMHAAVDRADDGVNRGARLFRRQSFARLLRCGSANHTAYQDSEHDSQETS